MANKKISELTAKASQLEDSDLVMISDYNGATYDTKSVTGAEIRPYKTILFTLSQIGTAAPTKDWSYETEVTQTFTLARSTIGTYTLTASSALFTSNKTFVNITPGGASAYANLGAYVTSTTVITLASSDSTDGNASDDLLSVTNLEIKIIK